MPTARRSVAVAALNGKIYVTGGVISDGLTYGSEPVTVEIYDPSTDSWTTGSPMSAISRVAPGGASVGGLFYALGGSGIYGIEAYDPLTGTWSVRAAMNKDRGWFSAGVVNGKILVLGGYSTPTGYMPIADMEEYDPQANSWTARQSLPVGIWFHSVAAIDGILYSVGGDTSYGPPWVGAILVTSAVWAYSPASDSWSARTGLPVPRARAACGVIDGEIYIVGGATNAETFSTMYIYNPATDKWRRGPDMPNARRDHGAAVVGGVLYVVGGVDPNSGATAANLWAYRPK